MTTPTATPSLKLRRIDWGDGGQPREDYEVSTPAAKRLGHVPHRSRRRRLRVAMERLRHRGDDTRWPGRPRLAQPNGL